MLVGLIGHPVAHSKSPQMQHAAFTHIGLSDWRYELWDTPPEALPARMRELGEREDIAGCNVTIPHKQVVMPYLDEVSPHARAIGAVNTLFKRGRALLGDNTDWIGFLADLAFHGVDVHAGTQALVLGAGGSARAVVYALVSRGARVWMHNRTPARAQHLLDDLARSPYAREAREHCAVVASPLDPACRAVNLIVNCTPVGMWPHEDNSPWPDRTPFPAGVTLYDLVYKPRRTKLMRQAEAAGARAIGGIGMLAEQGAAAFERWTGVPAARVSAIMREAIQDA
ncbi:MAG: shikimate dehydrogenase [Chloroflexi bacterium]|jgi:shikimate dehydrogenase|uniref:Shikimate dehydrogenase (NADP(+)) n=1 Tax=Candidatus Thermofonsia Clade 3 bacterium TaxID=2364212 RepID=A0A2M8QEZ7_9CHLR|nr:shikimate dehydrogenase [Candidatus Roseilinea sp. NK_OTU-006]PJF48380.1 MAG: shikimate dehydrogenase [Candidatus Thermofonsia Clade 3 bacterium]RMG62529.1 MAG: shikimate dehydrogenase [Chloroflexota bacterium]